MGLSTSVLRPAILRLAHHPWFATSRPATRLGRAVAGRFVAGETLAEALAAARELADGGVASMLNHLGENVATPREALDERARPTSRRSPPRGADADARRRSISVKLTQLGLDESVERVARTSSRCSTPPSRPASA